MTKDIKEKIAELLKTGPATGSHEQRSTPARLSVKGNRNIVILGNVVIGGRASVAMTPEKSEHK